MVAWKVFQTRRPGEKELGRLFARRRRKDGRPADGFGVITGRASGWRGAALAVRDFDNRGGYERWTSRHPHLAAALPTARTGRGHHVYCYLAPADGERYERWADGELIADSGHYAVLPPSAHPDGEVYCWVIQPFYRQNIPMLRLRDTGFLPDGTGAGVRMARPVGPPKSPPRPPDVPRPQPADPPAQPENGMCPPAAGRPFDALPPAVRELILKTRPRRAGERDCRLFTFARGMRDLFPQVTQVARLKATAVHWWRRALPTVRTKEFEETWAGFQRAWRRATEPTGKWVQELGAHCDPADPPVRRLETIGQVMASRSADGTFYLSCRTAAAALGLGKTRTAELLDRLVTTGVFVRVVPGRRGRYRRDAAVYRLDESG